MIEIRVSVAASPVGKECVVGIETAEGERPKMWMHLDSGDSEIFKLNAGERMIVIPTGDV
jgi:hypothetical protein